MNLYKFMLTTYGETKITKQVLEAEEKPKTYSVFDGLWTSRVNKKDITCPSPVPDCLNVLTIPFSVVTTTFLKFI